MSKLIDKLVKKFNGDGAIKFSDKDIFKEQSVWVHTGSPELDFNLGILGFPVGITEIAGKSRSGKTTLALMGMKNFQRDYEDGVCIILSSENRDNKEYAQQIGINTDNVLIIKSKFVEDLFYKLQLQIDYIAELWVSEKLEGRPKIFVMWDSVGATLSRSEQEAFKENVKNTEKTMEKGTKGETKHSQPGAFAKQAKMCAKNMLGQIYDKDIIFLAINHTMANIGGNGRKSGGGEWLEYLPTIRLETTLIEHIKIDEIEVAQLTKVKVVKNDFGSRKATIVEILLGYGYVLTEEDIDFAIKKGILVQDGKTKISFMKGKLAWSSKRTFYKLYEEKHKLLPILYKKIKDARHSLVLESKEVEILKEVEE